MDIHPTPPTTATELLGPGPHTAFLVNARGTETLTHKQTRATRFVAPSRGVRYLASAPDPQVARTAAASLVSSDAAVLSDVTAARSWNLPLPPWIGLDEGTLPIALAVPAGMARPQRRGVRGRRLRLPAEHLTTLDGLALTTAARTWLDCAELMPIEYLVAMGDVILRRNLASREELTSILAWGARRRGIVSARRALPLLDPGAESPGESLVRAHCLLAGLPRPHCNLNIVHLGGWLARADLAWPEAKVIVEYDGVVHWSDEQRRHDARRRNVLQEAGWQVIVLTANDLRQPWVMVALIRSALASRLH